MKHIFNTSKGCYQQFCRINIILLSCFWLIGCSGGISGTGDGGPVVVIDPDNTGTEDVSPDASATVTSTTPSVFDHQIFPQRLTTQFSGALISSRNLDQRISDLTEIPVTQKISTQLNAVMQQSIQAQLDLANIEELLLESLEQCDSADPCSTVPNAITTTLSPETLDFQQSLQPQTAQAESNVFSYSNVSYARETAGYFDQKLQYTNQSGTSVLLQWTTDNQLVSVVAENNAITTYLLTDFRQGTTTLRTDDKTSATVFQAVLNGTAAVGTTIEGDWHGNQQHYIRATADEASVVLYAIHPTDSTVMPTREVFDVISGNYAIEACTTENAVCANWQTVANDSSAIGARLTANQATIGDFSLSISSSLQISIPAEVDEFVIATDIGTEQPEARSLVCSGQRVLDSVRSFCWQPLPLAGAVQVYEESTGNGNAVFQQLPDARVQ